jgi:hypothetical protein
MNLALKKNIRRALLVLLPLAAALFVFFGLNNSPSGEIVSGPAAQLGTLAEAADVDPWNNWDWNPGVDGGDDGDCDGGGGDCH